MAGDKKGSSKQASAQRRQSPSERSSEFSKKNKSWDSRVRKSISRIRGRAA